MFCKHCGVKNEEGGKFCIKCGKAIGAGSAAQIVEAAVPIADEKPKSFKLTTKEPLKGLGGWLTLVCLGLIAGVIMNVVGFFDELSTLSGGNLEGYSSLQNAILILIHS